MLRKHPDASLLPVGCEHLRHRRHGAAWRGERYARCAVVGRAAAAPGVLLPLLQRAPDRTVRDLVESLVRHAKGLSLSAGSGQDDAVGDGELCADAFLPRQQSVKICNTLCARRSGAGNRAHTMCA